MNKEFHMYLYIQTMFSFVKKGAIKPIAEIKGGLENGKILYLSSHNINDLLEDEIRQGSKNIIIFGNEACLQHSCGFDFIVGQWRS